MGFFDDIGKALSDAGDTAIKKAKDFGEISKLNLAIKNEEKNIQQTLAAIGKLVADRLEAAGVAPEAVAENCLAGLSEAETESIRRLMGEVAGAKKRIAEANAQLSALKGTVTCPKCGAECPKDAAYCAGCGSRMESVPKSDKVFCTGCGAQLPADSAFCTNCGKPLNVTAQPQGQPAEEEAPAEPAEPTEPTEPAENAETAENAAEIEE